MKKLIQQSDVLVENFVAGKLASMGLGWEVNIHDFTHISSSDLIEDHVAGLPGNHIRASTLRHY
jgi:hypothetical protein